ncbi:hypothetical protein Tco_1109998 [Tanacetum coccineum]|uniref:Uncharacterized protein n=1 Tax=Tanacetum coccineum TaxID=301880 RepID=A0ABQ5IIZ2_9ASTR
MKTSSRGARVVGMVGGGASGGVTNGVVMGEVSGVCGDVSSGVVGAVEEALEALVMFEGDLRTEFYKFSSKEEDGECKQKVIIIGRKAKIRPKYAYVIPDQPDLLKRDPPFVAKGSGCLEQKSRQIVYKREEMTKTSEHPLGFLELLQSSGNERKFIVVVNEVELIIANNALIIHVFGGVIVSIYINSRELSDVVIVRLQQEVLQLPRQCT